MSEQHEMLMESISAIGTEEWVCPDCERRLLRLTWHPQSKIIIVEAGNEHALHLSCGDWPTAESIQDKPIENSNLPEEEEYRLRPWLEWLERVDFDDW